MALPSIFKEEVVTDILTRLDQLNFDSKAKWGTMNAAQMLAHTNVSYDLAEGRAENKANVVMKFLLKLLIKPMVTNEKPYPKNSKTAPVFIIANERDFEKEKAELIANLQFAQQKGASYYEGKHNPSFGPLTAEEWNNLFYKHLDHHFKQFGV